MGLVDRSYLSVVKRALGSILSVIDEHGVVRQVSYGTPMGKDSLGFYKKIPLRPMPYGQAMAILFLLECRDLRL